MTGIRNIDTDSGTSETLIDIKEVTDFIEQTRSDAVEFIKNHEIHDIGNTIADEFGIKYKLIVRKSQPGLTRVRGFMYYQSETSCNVLVGESGTVIGERPSELTDSELAQAVHLLAERNDECREKAAEFVQSELTDVAEIAEVLPDDQT